MEEKKEEQSIVPKPFSALVSFSFMPHLSRGLYPVMDCKLLSNTRMKMQRITAYTKKFDYDSSIPRPMTITRRKACIKGQRYALSRSSTRTTNRNARRNINKSITASSSTKKEHMLYIFTNIERQRNKSQHLVMACTNGRNVHLFSLAAC